MKFLLKSIVLALAAILCAPLLKAANAAVVLKAHICWVEQEKLQEGIKGVHAKITKVCLMYASGGFTPPLSFAGDYAQELFLMMPTLARLLMDHRVAARDYWRKHVVVPMTDLLKTAIAFEGWEQEEMVSLLRVAGAVYVLSVVTAGASEDACEGLLGQYLKLFGTASRSGFCEGFEKDVGWLFPVLAGVHAPSDTDVPA